ncbi:mRNA decay activator protein ZFP36L1b [Stigmatopora nigra]
MTAASICSFHVSEVSGKNMLNCSQLCADTSSQVNLSRYKTELCRPFEENGSCKYGAKCQFAHGPHELRSLTRHPKYKTDLCRTFHTIGFCPYGPRCHFIHNPEERRGPLLLSASGRTGHPCLQHSFSFAGFPSSGGSRNSPASVTPPPSTCCAEDLTEWSGGPSTSSGLFAKTPAALSPIIPCFFQPASEGPPSPLNSLSDQEGYQSSLGSLSGSESPLLDALRRLPIFSRLSVSDE